MQAPTAPAATPANGPGARDADDPPLPPPPGTRVSVCFEHGVGSFDPLPRSVLLWTRVSVSHPHASVEVGWEVAAQRDVTFAKPLAR